MIRSTALRRAATHRSGDAATTQVDGAAASFLTSGNAEKHRHTVVFIHGGGGDAHLWRRQLPFFGHSCYCIAVDLPGHGRSEGAGYQNIEPYAGFVSRFLDALAVRQKVVLVGHALGGLVAQQLALAEPGRVAALVLVGTGGGWRVRAEVLEALRRGEPITDVLRGLFAPDTPPELWREHLKHWNTGRPEVRYGDCIASYGFDAMRRLDELRLPTLVVGGEADPVALPTALRTMADGIAGAEFRLIPGAGHFTMLEQPEAFNAALDAFLDRM